MAKEAKARIKINQLLTEAGWHFLDSEEGKANIRLEMHVKSFKLLGDELGDDFEKAVNGFADYVLLDEKGLPFIVLEAKRESIHPLHAKEQARRYANQLGCRFVILSNGNQHYLWDLALGNPKIIQTFPSPHTLVGYDIFKPNKEKLIAEKVSEAYIALTQKHDYLLDPRYKNEKERVEFLAENKLVFLRKYQVRAIERIQEEVKTGKDRFLFEMATGTGKTLTAAAIIKLFLTTGNARRVLFLVDRIELENQAAEAFQKYLKNYCQCVIYKENKDDWQKAEIVVSTVQSFLFQNKYKRIFKATDFDLVISDEAHRSIGGNSRAVFDYFLGYKLGLTATPKDYLKKIDVKALGNKDPRALERRLLLDTYTTFGCEDGKPTFQYSLLHGIKDGYLINPIVVDVRTEITTQLLSEEGYNISLPSIETAEEPQAFYQRDFEKSFFSEYTNQVFCKTFLDHALRDPITEEIGKTIIFCVSQAHALKIAEILNEFAHTLFPNKYNSDFALQVTSNVQQAQDFTTQFTYNRLRGNANFNPLYKTAKTRVCVTVGMMTTGYDCPDLLNICLMRPIFSPTDFIQMKGRGTRKHSFLKELVDKNLHTQVTQPEKTNFKLFDFFANCEYFEEKFNYDEVIKLPPKPSDEGGEPFPIYTPLKGEYEHLGNDPLKQITEMLIGKEGMKIDRMYFDRFEEDMKAKIQESEKLQKMMEDKNLDAIEHYILANIFDKPTEYYSLEKLRAALKMDRRLSLREIIEKLLGHISYFKNTEELLEEEFDKFDSRYLPEENCFTDAKTFFKSYIIDANFRQIIESKQFAMLNTHPNGEAFRRLPQMLKVLIPEYIKDNISLNRFMA